MANENKIKIVEAAEHRFKNSTGIYFTNYTGMNVDQATELRASFKDNNVDFLISKNNRIDNLLFLIGLILGPLIYSYFTNQKIEISITNSLFLLIGGGILVGLGTRISGGCTSGHGISGVGRFSLRSIVATITFMIVGILTVLIKNIS